MLFLLLRRDGDGGDVADCENNNRHWNIGTLVHSQLLKCDEWIINNNMNGARTSQNTVYSTPYQNGHVAIHTSIVWHAIFQKPTKMMIVE